MLIAEESASHERIRMTRLAELQPTIEEVRRWVCTTLAHALHIEYYLHRLQIGSEDPERPHDIIGRGNKLEWEAIRGFAVQSRRGTDKLLTLGLLKSSLSFHREQFHHRMWNEPHAHSSADNMKLGAVDAVCSLLEARSYQGGKHGFAEIEEIAKKNLAHKQAWMLLLTREMALVPPPPEPRVVSPLELTNIGLAPGMFSVIRDRSYEALRMLERDHGYAFEELLVGA